MVDKALHRQCQSCNDVREDNDGIEIYCCPPMFTWFLFYNALLVVTDETHSILMHDRLVETW